MKEIKDWNKMTVQQHIDHLETTFTFDSSGTAKSVFELIKAYELIKNYIMEEKIELLLEKLYAIKDDDKFYFMTYGKDWIKELVSEHLCPNPDCKSTNIKNKETYDYCEDCRRIFNGQYSG